MTPDLTRVYIILTGMTGEYYVWCVGAFDGISGYLTLLSRSGGGGGEGRSDKQTEPAFASSTDRDNDEVTQKSH